MEFARERKIFMDFCRQYGGNAVLFRRGWVDDGDRQVETLTAVSESVCLLTLYNSTLAEVDPAAQNRSKAKIYLPDTVDLRAGDCVEVRWGDTCEKYAVCGQPQRYPAYTAAEVRKEEWI